MPFLKQRLLKVGIFLSALLLSGCGKYAVSINENTVYDPRNLFKDFQVGDKALEECLQQTIEDYSVRRPNDLKVLSCTKAGIKDLKGLDVFEGLEQMNLSDNKITTLSPLTQFTQLKTLLIENNQLVDIQAVLTSPNLETLNIKGNPNILCSDIQQLKLKDLKELTLPSDCRKTAGLPPKS